MAELNRGYEATRPLTRTANDRMLGVAMAPAVLRNGAVKGHLVFYAPYVLAIGDENNNHFSQALYLAAHECAYTEDLKRRDQRFPGTILRQQIYDPEEVIFAPLIEALWQEYAASRISAIFGEGQTSVFEECLVNSLKGDRRRDIAGVVRRGGVMAPVLI